MKSFGLHALVKQLNKTDDSKVFKIYQNIEVIYGDTG